jgi:stage V sporulation protein B
VLGLVYAADYVELGAGALIPLALGTVAFCMLAINGTILNGAGLTRPAIGVAAVTLAVAFVGNWIAIPIAAEYGRVLETAATVSGGAMVIGAIASGVILSRKLGAFLPWMSLARIAIATAFALAAGWMMPFHGKLMTLVEAVAVGLVFLGVLVATRELGKHDLAAIKAVRARGTSEKGEP